MGATAVLAAVGLALLPVQGAWGATIIVGGPIDLGVAESFGVLGGAEVTNSGSSVITGDVGVSPGTSLTGFPPGMFTGASHLGDAVATEAQTDLVAAMNAAASLTPTSSGLANLTGMSLSPGVYEGGALSIDGAGSLTLAGSATSVWVFTASSTLVTGSASEIVLTGGASACNVFWLVGSSATLGTGSDFVGTIMAVDSITATSGSDIVGRLLAATSAVTLDTTDIVKPSGCAAPGSIVSTVPPTITSGTPSTATLDSPYAFAVTASGTPDAGFAITAGTLPAGLALDGTTGLIAGTPVAEGTSPFTITASNGYIPDAVLATAITVVAAAPAATLPPTGNEPGALLFLAALLVAGGGVLYALRHRRVRAVTGG